jgi:predicted transcriptional regulator
VGDQAAPVPPLPTDAELEILQVLWDRGPSTVREVHDELIETRKVRYTTALKLMQNLLSKGLVRRDDSRRSHVFEPAVERSAIEARLVARFVDGVFEGSTARLVLRALAAQPASPEDLDEIRRLARQLDGEDA